MPTANMIRAEKKNLNGMKLPSLEINTPIYINDSLCIYYKKLLGLFNVQHSVFNN